MFIIAKILVLGAGTWGMAIISLLLKNNNDIYLYSTSKNNDNELILSSKYPSIYFKINYTKNIMILSKLKFDFIIIAIPSHIITYDIIQYIEENMSNSIIIIATKGLYNLYNRNNISTLSQMFSKIYIKQICVLTGPTHAEEIFMKLPSSLLIASKNYNCALKVKKLFEVKYLYTYISDDILGAELGGSLKNIVAIAAGISDGLKLGDNFKAALITKGLGEITKLGKLLGAKQKTFMGLSGIGDIIVTCNSLHSRNYRAGLLISKQMSIKEIFHKINATIEGINAIKYAILLSKKYNKHFPLIFKLYKIIEEKDNVDNFHEILSSYNSNKFYE